MAIGKNIHMKLTDNFSRWEFECKDGSEMPDYVVFNTYKLAVALQTIRGCIGYPIAITNAYRSLEHNRSIGSKDTSQHTQGKAADLQVKEMSVLDLYETIETLIEWGHVPEGGLGVYNTFVHYDIRGKKARWDNRQ